MERHFTGSFLHFVGWHKHDGQSIMFPVTDPSSCEDQWPRSRI